MNKRRDRIVLLTVAALVLLWAAVRPAGAGEEAVLLWGDLRPGPHGVGFRVIEAVDPTRTYAVIPDGGDARVVTRSRPLRFGIWYPAEGMGEAAAMAFVAYVDAFWSPVEMALGDLTEEGRRRARSSYRAASHALATTEAFERLLGTATAAHRDAPSVPGSHPLVVYACGFDGRPPAHSVTCEYLASHGFVVACSTSQGDTSLGMTFDAAGVEAQSRDLEFAVASLRTAPGDVGEVGVVGFSFGAHAALIMAMRQPGVAAVASLDGSIGSWSGLEALRRSPSFAAGRLRAPLLHMNRADGAWNDLAMFDSLVFSERLLLSFEGMDHDDFLPLRVIAAATTGPPPRPATLGYNEVCRRLRDFLNAHLKGDGPALEAVRRPSMAGVRLSVRNVPTVDPPPTEDEFARLLMSVGGVARARPLFDAARARYPEIPFVREATLDAIGGRLMERGRHKDAIAVYRMAVETFPRSSLAAEALASAYRTDGDRERAIEHFRKTLELEPRNFAAAEAIEDLRRDRP